MTNIETLGLNQAQGSTSNIPGVSSISIRHPAKLSFASDDDTKKVGTVHDMVVNKRQNNKRKSMTHVGSLETPTSSVSGDKRNFRRKSIKVMLFIFINTKLGL